MTVGSQMPELDWGASLPPQYKIGCQNTPYKLALIKRIDKFWGEICSENYQLFESFYRSQFTLMYHGKSIFLSESTGSVALIFHHNLLS